jgi:hypothetical protein
LGSILATLTDVEVLAELAAIPPLADEAEPCWDDDGYGHRSRTRTSPCGASSRYGGCETRSLIRDRACFGDRGEIMRGLGQMNRGLPVPDVSIWGDARESVFDLFSTVKQGRFRLPPRAATANGPSCRSA